MIRTLLATTAVATLLASGAFAQEATTPAAAPAPATQDAATAAPATLAEGNLVTNVIGETVYNGTGDNAENIGKVSDIVFDKDGKAASVVIGVGGFLGIGTKNVAYDYSKLQWAEKDGDRWLVAATSKDELTALPEFDSAAYAPAPAPQASTDSTAPATTTDTTAPADMNAAPAVTAEGTLATHIIGENVYNGTGEDAQTIGNVNDVVMAADGQAQSLVIGVGGFLGIAEKNVALDYAKATWAERDGDRWLVVEATKEGLQALPEFNRKAYDPAAVPATVTDGTGTVAPMAPAPADQTAEAPAVAPDAGQTAAIDKSALTEVPAGELRTEDLVGTTVYGADDARVGEIGDIALTADNKADAAIIDVGGFLGIGEKEVAVAMDNLKFMADKDGKKYLYTSFTKDQLEAQAAYDKATYGEKRDEQRMNVN
jgi:sporulation protein YlmC with PRC-barrel domain